MFLHSGAAMHRHEFSPVDTTRRTSIPKRSPLTRSAFSSPIPRIVPTYESSIPITQSPAKTLSEYIPRNIEHSVRFQESELDTMSDGGRSVANSEGSEATTGGSRRRRRSTRTSTTFHFAQPAPTGKHKQKIIKIRPKLILQLQRLAPNARPRPHLDVLTSTVIAPRLLKKFPRMFRGKTALGVNDLIVVKSEEYETPDNYALEDSESDEEGLANREVVAAICQLPKDLGGSQGKTEIALYDSTWIATPLSKNRYEFTSINEQGEKTMARWVRRAQRNSVDMSTATSGTSEFNFTFSILNPNVRRHPIMGTLTHNTLIIPDHYVTVSSSSGMYPPTSPMHSLQDDTSGEEGPTTERMTYTIDDDIKLLIQVTGTWVALRQGISRCFTYPDAMASSSTTPTPRVASNGRIVSQSVTPDGSKVPAIDVPSHTPDSNRNPFGSVSGKLRRSYSKASPAITSPSRFEQYGPPKRAVSVGTAFMQRAEATRRAANTSSTMTSDGDSKSHLPKRGSATATTPSPGPSVTPPQSNALTSLSTPPETPTRPQRRVQSAYIPTGPLHWDEQLQSTQRHSLDGAHSLNIATSDDKPKISRWKAFTNIFRRTRNN